MTNVLDFARAKQDGRRISMATCDDTWSARLTARSQVNAVLVGNSVAMVMHGASTTVSATVDDMALDTRAASQLRALGFGVEYVKDREGHRSGAVRLVDVRLIDNITLEDVTGERG
ncbi:MAG: hypothetical protein CL483_04930 [Acidobacteria bacterium]|nr:hypothetical protein [Acidobacteriota bacterium]